jgi:uncharacterized protein
MQHTTITPQQNYIIRIVRGEDVIEKMTKFCQKNNIFSGSFTGIGACDEVELGSYSVETKKYIKKQFKGEFEIANLTGIISDKKIHVHATIGDESFNAYTGHVNSMRISATCEIYLTSGEKSISRKLDDETGLELIDI